MQVCWSGPAASPAVHGGEVRRRADDGHAHVGPMRTATMSFATCSPRRTPASKRSATMSVRPYSTMISTLISG